MASKNGSRQAKNGFQVRSGPNNCSKTPNSSASCFASEPNAQDDKKVSENRDKLTEKLEVIELDVDCQTVKEDLSEKIDNETVKSEREKVPADSKDVQTEENAKVELERRKEVDIRDYVDESNENADSEYKPQRENAEKRSKRKNFMDRMIVRSEYLSERFEIGKTLGDGNFAVVKRCRLRSVGCEYAMKIIAKSKIKEPEEMFETEASILRRCRHRNIVRLIEDYETRSEIYLIMELVQVSEITD